MLFVLLIVSIFPVLGFAVMLIVVIVFVFVSRPAALLVVVTGGGEGGVLLVGGRGGGGGAPFFVRIAFGVLLIIFRLGTRNEPEKWGGETEHTFAPSLSS
jgi:hypothetical protein